MVDITKSYFELFQLPVACRVDLSLLSGRYRELQKAVHPDRFAGADDRQQRLAIQYAAYVNEGYETLKSPMARSLYLLELAGYKVDLEKNTVMDPVFLMEQMALREAMSEVRDHADPEAELERLVDEVDEGIETLFDTYEQLWLVANEESTEAVAKEDALKTAQDTVRKMQFMVKLAAELEQLESELLDS
ncbi:Fe-S protein assembly co-chaperone HscB [Endozoicomonas euniceicola]|uniref:Co-chaperone protein HscB homolog n=1 Tax=Endozoicomonas euniceicola TaxID=1234143 RepID=A0ABY6GWV8_9GAMM|nr:Fe-S protein assembly co-chaperone HscB [Endozoicomonas euniceicola]UYM16556.1 Fe-S protein assembly co-chaperone HscB [Endozoicomonas euniceicola]